MKLKGKLIPIIALLVLGYLNSIGQTSDQKEHPVIWEPIPDFTLNDIQSFRKKNVTRAELIGKPVILDFFSVGCSGCFASFPKTNELNQKFKDQVDIILVGREHEKIRQVYESFKKRQKLNLPVTYQADLLKRWKIYGVPRLIWIDAEGIVRGVTGSNELNAVNIEAFIKGDKFIFNTDYSYRENTTSLKEPLLIEGNGGEEKDFSFRSILAPFNGVGSGFTPWSLEAGCKTLGGSNRRYYGFQCTGATIWDLYSLAYSGTTSFRDMEGNISGIPIIELSDPSKFHYDFNTAKNIYTYSIIVPVDKGSPGYIQKLMQQDLERYLGFKASIEKRMAPYWRLTVTDQDKQKLKTKHPEIKTKVEGDYSGKKYWNAPVKVIAGSINGLDPNGLAVVDQTGIDFNIDLEIDAAMTDMEAVWNALRKKGLILEKAEKQMKVIVIKDCALK